MAKTAKRISIKILVINLILLLLVGVAGYWGYSTLHPKTAIAALQTVTVTSGDVQATVSASGKVISPGDVGLSPLSAGVLKSLNVAVGDHVLAGQVLAQLDTTSLTIAIAQANISLISSKATADNSLSSLQQAQAAVEAANKTMNEQTPIIQANATTYQAAVDAAKKALDDGKVKNDYNAQNYQNTVDSALSSYNYAKFLYDNYVATTLLANPTAILTQDYCGLNPTDTGCASFMSQYNTYTNALNSYNNALSSQKMSLYNDASALANLNTAYQSALTNQTNNLKKDAITIEGYQTSVSTAQSSLNSLSNTQNANASYGSATVAQAQLQIAQANYDTAVRNLAAATIKAPVSGDVASISAAVGGNVTTQATQATTTTAATGFIVLTNTSALRVNASFSEADAAKIAAGQLASFTFDALPNDSATGKVLQMDMLPTTSGGVTSYGATFSLDSPVAGLKPGMTATATVMTGVATGVIQVTAQAVTSRGGNSYVNLVTTVNGKQTVTQTAVMVVLKGDSSDEIQSGLKVGDVVSLPVVARTASSNGFAVGGVPGGFGALAGTGALGGGGGGGRGGGGGGGGG